MARKHYHVLCGLRGMYMPNSNDVHATRKGAESGAAWLAETYRDDGETRVTGSARHGYYTVGDNECIEITVCDAADCMRGDDNE